VTIWVHEHTLAERGPWGKHRTFRYFDPVCQPLRTKPNNLKPKGVASYSPPKDLVDRRMRALACKNRSHQQDSQLYDDRPTHRSPSLKELQLTVVLSNSAWNPSKSPICPWTKAFTLAGVK